ncbi:putative MPP superfamily phosphohydrolase [Paenibacillus anaericanus]|uniref:metallophosphoesterase n=1 Tax=Paenibacillus anaericanus TaxID=170367 RepID=UPI00278A6D67|nr:metallophosphoesterase [Paenibacillus anaericanus]MDQ0090917.1 putative MPP superfamily phosphohydrolase [Paenibacillus anaericanus]
MIYYIILFIAAVIYFLLVFPTQWLKVERVRYSCGIGSRVLQISDLHVEKLRISPRRLTRLIKKEAPDYIVLTGDFTQKSRYLSKVQRYAHAIAGPGIPVFAVLGNHDHRLKFTAFNQLIRILEGAGIQVLINESIVVDNFQIVGIDDFGSKKSKVDKAFANVDPSKPILVLTHNPNLVLSIKRKYTYLMAGHFHGMQFNVPYLFQYIDKGRLAADGIYKGMHSGTHGTFYISKGIGQAGINARFLIRSEVTLHEL